MKKQPYHKASGRCHRSHLSAEESALTDGCVCGEGDQIWFYFQVTEAQHLEAIGRFWSVLQSWAELSMGFPPVIEALHSVQSCTFTL